MAGQNLSTFDAMLKEDYLGPIREQINGSTILMSRLEKNEEDVEGSEAVVPLHTGRNSGVGARAEGGTLPAAGAQGYAVARYGCRYNYGRIQITGPSMAASRTNKGAFVKVLDSEIQGMVRDFKDDLNRQLHGNGTGVLALMNDNPGGASTDLIVDTPGTQYLQKGMILDIVDPASTTAGDARANATGIVVASKATALKAIMTANVHADVADNDLVVRKGSYLLESMGLKGIVNTVDPLVGTLTIGGIPRATAGNEYWKAFVLANSGTARALTLDLMQQAWDGAEEEGGEISLIMTSRAVRRKYVTLVKADGRTVNSMDLDGGFDAVDYNGKALVVDKYCLPGRMYFLDESTLAIYRMSDVDWINKEAA